MNRHGSHSIPAAQRGAALAVALVLLVVLTLLGIAAVRATQTELRLAQNAESRTSAQQKAESLLNVVLADRSYVPVNEDLTQRSCRLPAGGAPAAQFSCATASVTLLLDAGDPSRQVPQDVLDHGYVEVVRQPPLFVSVDFCAEQMTPEMLRPFRGRPERRGDHREPPGAAPQGRRHRLRMNGALP